MWWQGVEERNHLIEPPKKVYSKARNEAQSINNLDKDEPLENSPTQESRRSMSHEEGYTCQFVGSERWQKGGPTPSEDVNTKNHSDCMSNQP